MGEKSNAYKIFVVKPERKRSLGRPRHMWEDAIKMDLRQIGWVVTVWIDLDQVTNQWWALVNTVMNFRVP
jgi:hypothetical protein